MSLSGWASCALGCLDNLSRHEAGKAWEDDNDQLSG